MTATLDETFSADWLALREPVDHAARNPAVLEACLDYLARTSAQHGSEPIRIVDMGCGTGSTVRGLAPLIAARFPGVTQHWHLLDRDTELLARASAMLSLQLPDTVRIETRHADLADLNSLDATLGEIAPTLVTGSALIDLVSEAWVDKMAGLTSRHAAAVLFALNYDGEDRWTPPHDLDAAILDAFNADQRRDKGFGPALGPMATEYLSRRYSAQGFAVTSGSSDWHLDAERNRSLMTMLAEGIADAARRTLTPTEVDSWHAARRAATHAVITHSDVFASPQV